MNININANANFYRLIAWCAAVNFVFFAHYLPHVSLFMLVRLDL